VKQPLLRAGLEVVDVRAAMARLADERHHARVGQEAGQHVVLNLAREALHFFAFAIRDIHFPVVARHALKRNARSVR